jgi:hypothetical protein
LLSRLVLDQRNCQTSAPCLRVCRFTSTLHLYPRARSCEAEESPGMNTNGRVWEGEIALRLNQRPGKTLGFETPASKLQASVASTV